MLAFKEGNITLFQISCTFLNVPSKLLILNGGQRRDRTADAGLFRAA